MKNLFTRFLLDVIVIGAALFSMLFGAGNMIFPPFLGLQSGSSWFAGFLSFFFADIGLAMLAMFALIRKRGPVGIVEPLGNTAGAILLSIIALCLGIFIGVPRTAATTYELSIQPLFDQISLPVFCLVFFVMIMLLSLSESAVVDIVGKILTPVLFIGLMFLIFQGVLTPVGEILSPADSNAVVPLGISSGYQAMDVFGAVFLGVLVLNGAIEKGYSTPSAQARVSAAASLVASIALFVVYLGLTYLGATASSIFHGVTNHTDLLNSLIQVLLPGKAGTIFFGVIVGLACLTTAIALTSSTASYLASLTRGKVSYRAVIMIICVFGAAVACVGVDQLISVSGKILAVVYPPVLVLVALAFLGNR